MRLASALAFLGTLEALRVVEETAYTIRLRLAQAAWWAQWQAARRCAL